MSITFENPWFVLLLSVLFVVFIIRKKIRATGFILNIATTNDNKNRINIINIFNILNCFIVVCLILILMEPVLIEQQQNGYYEGINIMLSIDCSQSMLNTNDGTNNQTFLEIAKETAINFIKNRKYDKIGANIFAGESMTIFPLSNLHNLLIDKIWAISGNFSDGTAIGLGIATALLRFQNICSNNKTIILITDGINNYWNISPYDAAKIAKEMNVKVYCIAIGNSTDWQQIQQISEVTGGKCYIAKNKLELEQIYIELDKLEKNEYIVEHSIKSLPINHYLIMIVLFLLAVVIIIRSTKLKFM